MKTFLRALWRGLLVILCGVFLGVFIFAPFFALSKVDGGVAAIEKEHEERYNKLLANLTNGEVFVRQDEVTWQCRNCGYTVTAKEAPERCPVCDHPQAYFEIKRDNY